MMDIDFIDSFYIVVVVILLGSYYYFWSVKHHLKTVMDELIESYKKETKDLVSYLEKKIDRYHISCKLERLCFIGIGGGGCNIVEDISDIDPWHKFIHINSDLQALNQKSSRHKILLGFEQKEGLGCGGVAECGVKLVDNTCKEKLFQLTKDEKHVYVVVTLGGGVGSGAAPEIIEYLKSLDKELIVFVTMPFAFEGKNRQAVAKSALKNIQTLIANVTVLKNDNLIEESAEEGLGTRETFKKSSKLVYRQVLMDFIGNDNLSI
jgi:cell division protein FtsZ